MAFKFYSNTYGTFYQLLRNKFINRIDPKNLIKWRENDRSIWSKDDPQEGGFAMFTIFGLDYSFYWSDKKTRHKNSKEGYLYEPSETFILAFKFLGYSLEHPWYEKHGALEKSNLKDLEVEELYKKFLKDQCQYFQIPNHDFVDVENYVSRDNDLIPKNKTLGNGQNHFNHITKDNDITDIEINEVILKKRSLGLVNNYFNSISSKNYFSAYNCWNPSSVERYFEGTIEGFINKVSYIEKIWLSKENGGWLIQDYGGDYITLYFEYEKTLECSVSDSLISLLTYGSSFKRFNNENISFFKIINHDNFFETLKEITTTAEMYLKTQLWQSLQEALGTKLAFSTTYHPQTDK